MSLWLDLGFRERILPFDSAAARVYVETASDLRDMGEFIRREPVFRCLDLGAHLVCSRLGLGSHLRAEQAEGPSDARQVHLHISSWDSTAVTDTYQAGRYMRAPFPDDDGWTTIDFNRADDAPCVLTPHSVCSLPP